jgi:hypothetical protein
MRGMRREDVPVALEGGGVEVRLEEVGGGMMLAFLRLPKGTDLRPLLQGLPNDLCQCPHFGYMLKGKVRMHTGSGAQDYEAGQAFYWAPGHAPEALEDTEYVDFSPSEEFKPVLEHVKRQAEAAAASRSE